MSDDPWYPTAPTLCPSCGWITGNLAPDDTDALWAHLTDEHPGMVRRIRAATNVHLGRERGRVHRAMTGRATQRKRKAGKIPRAPLRT